MKKMNKIANISLVIALVAAVAFVIMCMSIMLKIAMVMLPWVIILGIGTIIIKRKIQKSRKTKKEEAKN
jgi:uncharacterized SAM-binding protein YcdF (DUF218 family)